MLGVQKCFRAFLEVGVRYGWVQMPAQMGMSSKEKKNRVGGRKQEKTQVGGLKKNKKNNAQSPTMRTRKTETNNVGGDPPIERKVQI